MSEKPKISQLRLLILAPSDAHCSNSPTDAALPPPVAASLFSSFLQALTKSSPSKDLTTFAGYTTHTPLSLKTKYYSANVNLWCDELPTLVSNVPDDSSSDLSRWKEQMLSEDAGEVRDVIGGIVVLLPFNAGTNARNPKALIGPELQFILAVSGLRDRIEDETGRDMATLAVIQDITPSATIERNSSQDHHQTATTFAQQLEDTCVSDHGVFGWDIISWQSVTNKLDEDPQNPEGNNIESHEDDQKANSENDRNEFGEKTGIARVIEVLEQVNWLSTTTGEAGDSPGYDLVSTDDLLDNEDSFGVPTLKPKISANQGSEQDPIRTQSDEFQTEIMGLHSALREQDRLNHFDADDGEDIQVEQLGDLMQRVVAIREAASEMSGTEREAFARREINRIMQEINFD